MASLLSKKVEKLVHAVDVLIVDDNQFMRKVVRNLLVNVGVRTIHEAGDGLAGLEAIRTFVPDIVILDWEMPLLDGGEVARMIRSPGKFPVPDVPIIMLSGHVERWRIEKAQQLGDYYGPQPRRPDYELLRRAAAAGVQASRVPMAQAMPGREH